MKNIKIILADQERDYVVKFKEYLESQEGKNRFELISATTKEAFETLAKSENFDLLLATPYFFDSSLVHEIPIVIGLDDHTKKNNWDFPLIEKYQSLTKLIGEVLALYFEKIEQTEYFIANNGDTKIISTFSSTAGAGKTIFALNLANELTKLNLNVLYLNLETIHSTALFLKDDTDMRQSSELIYFTQKKSTLLLSKIEKYKKRDSYLNFDYFDFINNPAEMLEMKSEEIHYLLGILKSSDVYDYVIVDLDSQLHERNLEVLQASQKIVWLVKNDVTSIFKSEHMLENSRTLVGLEAKGNSALHFVMNYCHQEQHLETSLPIMHHLPFVRSWENLRQPTAIVEEDSYCKAVANLIVTNFVKVEENSDG
ncbi:AAA family ATPase [Carnobacterium gallinarum]|uniref:AAA family ATPase n=1 Tax=Carnobacterium gallinarum TaxID=2749 RepID=UPI00054D4ACF|nr:AAA family ATPase [Carnobacterium gallinarum]